MINHIVLVMLSILIITITGGMILFHFSNNAEKKKTADLKATASKLDENNLRMYTLITHI